mmetsp:Transcript_36646/g.87039  ORF Transcript_36646/g.87039 Transcript_36646/m.87039 type:complete len:223 (+) Transcript_36646:2157-2825(+)
MRLVVAKAVAKVRERWRNGAACPSSQQAKRSTTSPRGSAARSAPRVADSRAESSAVPLPAGLREALVGAGGRAAGEGGRPPAAEPLVISRQSGPRAGSPARPFSRAGRPGGLSASAGVRRGIGDRQAGPGSRPSPSASGAPASASSSGKDGRPAVLAPTAAEGGRCSGLRAAAPRLMKLVIDACEEDAPLRRFPADGAPGGIGLRAAGLFAPKPPPGEGRAS